MKITRRHLLWVLIAGVILAPMVWFLAPYNIAASKKHLPGVGWVLHGYMENTVRIRARSLKIPEHVDLSDPGLIRLGAAHYATGCATCHGAPGQPRNPLVEGMQPEPPSLSGSDYSEKEFYWLARHGLKYTGMPAWAGEGRDDEPWAVAAFLEQYDRLDAESYRGLAFGSVSEPEGAAVSFGDLTAGLDPEADCARCHGEDGLGRDGTAPKLAGQSMEYLEQALTAYASGRRESGFMEPVAAALSETRITALARSFAEKDGPWEGQPSPVGGDPARGRELAERGEEHDEVPSCVSCHGDAVAPPSKPEFPAIAGQDAYWLITWLHMWRDGPVPEGDQANLMRRAARELSDLDIRDLAAYYASQQGRSWNE